MGIIIRPDEPYRGRDCEYFSDSWQAPETIYAYFWEIVKCPLSPPAPNFVVIVCHQHPDWDCYWQNTDYGPGWVINVQAVDVPHRMRVQLFNPDGWTCFDGFRPGYALEHDIFDNVYTECNAEQAGHSGNCLLFWKEAAVKLLADMSLPTDAKVLMEFFITDDHKPVYKFCVPKYSMNVGILLSP